MGLLTAQLNAVFLDQHLPQLGYYNDLLYTAAAVAPASFNDILFGNNIDSFAHTGDFTGYIFATGSDAGRPYRLAKATPQSRATTWPAASAVPTAWSCGADAIGNITSRPLDAPAVIHLDDGTGALNQTLLVQNTSHSGVEVQVDGTDYRSTWAPTAHSDGPAVWPSSRSRAPPSSTAAS